MKMVTFIVSDEEADAIWEESNESGTTLWVGINDEDGHEVLDFEVVLDSIKPM